MALKTDISAAIGSGINDVVVVESEVGRCVVLLNVDGVFLAWPALLDAGDDLIN